MNEAQPPYTIKTTVPIMGVKFRGPVAQGKISSIIQGEHAAIIPEPDNAYDPNAIMIVWINPKANDANIHLGYVPKERCASILTHMEHFSHATFPFPQAANVELTFSVNEPSLAREIDRDLNEDKAFGLEKLTNKARSKKKDLLDSLPPLTLNNGRGSND